MRELSSKELDLVAGGFISVNVNDVNLALVSQIAANVALASTAIQSNTQVVTQINH